MPTETGSSETLGAQLTSAGVLTDRRTDPGSFARLRVDAADVRHGDTTATTILLAVAEGGQSARAETCDTRQPRIGLISKARAR